MFALLYTLADFTCEGIGDFLEWTVQGNLLTDPSNQDKEILVTTNIISVNMWSSVLTIRALPIHDGISVGYILFGQNFDFVTKVFKVSFCIYNHCHLFIQSQVSHQ